MSDFLLYTKVFPFIYIALCLSFATFIVISWKNIKWGVYLVCAFLPAYLIRFKGPLDIPMTALEVMILVLFAVCVLKKQVAIPAKTEIKKNKLLLIGGSLFLFSATVAMFVSPDFRAAAGIWKAYFIEPLIFFIIFISVIEKEDTKNVIKALGFSALYISLYAIAQKFLNVPIPTPWQTEMRATSIFPYPNAVGLFLAPLIPLLIYDLRFKISDLLSKFFLSATIILSILTIVFAKSEGAIVALVASLSIWLFIKLKSRGKIVLSIIGSAAIVAILFLNFFPFPQIKEKLLLNDWSGIVRKTVWSETWEMLQNAPIFGVGLSGHQTAIIPYHNAKWMEIFLYPHNIILNFWAETGILGLIGFIIIIIGFYKQLLSQKSEIGIYLFLSMTILLIHGLVDVPYFKNDLSILFWILIGMAILHPKQKIVD